MPYRGQKSGYTQKGVYERTKMPGKGGMKKPSKPSHKVSAPKRKLTEGY